MIYSIVGGTGTLGRELCRQLLNRYPSCLINIFSRCELKQAKMKESISSSNVRYFLGDITRPETFDPLKNSNIIFHVAALKHVDVLEENPESALYTNTVGTLNLANFCVNEMVEKMIFFTTDKAVDPINAYGFSKALAEKILLSKNKNQLKTSFIIYRWGNILGSSGSLLEVISNLVQSGKPIKVTDFTMTRFWLLIQDAVRFVLESYLDADKNQVHYPPNIKAARIMDVIDTYLKLSGSPNHPVIKIPVRPGEKYHENLFSDHNKSPLGWTTSRNCPHFTRNQLNGLIGEWLCNQRY